MTRIGYCREQIDCGSTMTSSKPGRGFRKGEILGRRLFAEPTESDRFVARDEAPAIPTTESAPLTPRPKAEPLLPRVAAGDSVAIEACLDRYGSLVWSLARKYFAETADAEDAVQEAFVSLWRNAARFDERIASETTFVAMISRRRLLDLVRRRVRRAADRPEGDAAMDDFTTQEPHAVRVEGVPLGPVEVAEEASRARTAMEQLKPEQQQVLQLAIGEGLSQSEIAERTGMPLGTVKSHARRGMQQLRSLLGVSADRAATMTEAAKTQATNTQEAK
ncbi:MAG: sigma-70 family RNA polymerase sigma factor [Planctomycetota bacterium]